MEKVQIAKHIFQVVNKQLITPHYIRVTLQGEGAKDFALCSLGANNKIMVPPAGQKKVSLSSIDPQTGEVVLPPEHERPSIRTYTHRAIDVEKKQIVIDFVNHGDNGPASGWALHAVPGDELGVAMKIRKSELVPDVDWYLLIGDATALPVLSVILEGLPQAAKGHCLVEVASKEDILEDLTHPGFTIQWVFNPHPESGSTLSEKVKEIALPHESRFAYVACEFSSVKQIRSYFRQDLQWTAKDIYAFSYWKAGTAEDRSAEERRDEKNA